MKVADLKPGMMLVPSINNYTKKRPALVLREAKMYRGDVNDTKIATACRISPRFYAYKTDVRHDCCIYMGSEKSDYHFDGVRTHHILLVGGELAIITGYEFRYMEEPGNDTKNLEFVSSLSLCPCFSLTGRR